MRGPGGPELHRDIRPLSHSVAAALTANSEESSTSELAKLGDMSKIGPPRTARHPNELLRRDLVEIECLRSIRGGQGTPC